MEKENIIEVMEVWRKEKVLVNEAEAKLVRFSNKNKCASYNAPEAELVYGLKMYADYIVNDITIDDIDTKLSSLTNPVRFYYAELVDYNATDNDPEQKLWNKLVDFVKVNEEEFFNKYGDFKDSCRKFLRANFEA